MQNFRKYITDSFTIDNIHCKNELVRMDMSDSVLTVFDELEHSLHRYRKDGKIYRHFWQKELLPYTVICSGYYNQGDSLFYIISREDTLYTFDRDLHLLRTQYIPVPLKYVKNGAYPVVYKNNMPIYQKGDTLITKFSYDDASDFFELKKEPIFLKMATGTNSHSLATSTFGAKPGGLDQCALGAPYFCFDKDMAYTIIPEYDTIYTYDLASGSVQKHPIGNDFYNRPLPFDNTENDHAKRMKQLATNFRYDGIYFNKHTKHFVLCFVLPATAKEGENPTTDDQTQSLLVLDEHLNKLYYTALPAGYYGAIMCMVPMPDGRMAIPYITNAKQKEAHETSLPYYIFDF